MLGLVCLTAPPLIKKLLFINNDISGCDIFRPHIGPHKSCGLKLNVQQARARAIVSPPVIMPLAPARDTVLYCALACFACACATGSSVLNWGGTRAPVRDRGVNAILVLPNRYHHFVSAKKEWHKRSVVCCLDWIAACLHAISL